MPVAAHKVPDKRGGKRAGSGNPNAGTSKLAKNANRITPQQEAFIHEMIQGSTKVEAARKVGCGDEGTCTKMGNAWLSDKYPHVLAAYNMAVAKRNAVAEYNAEQVLKHLQIGTFLNYCDWFEPGSIQGGYWTISKEKYEELPIEIKRLIKCAERLLTYDDKTGEPIDTGVIRVKMLDKEVLLGMCGRFMLGDKLQINANVMQLNWNEMITKQSHEITDLVEERIKVQLNKSLTDKDQGTLSNEVMNDDTDQLKQIILQPESNQ